MSEKKILQLWFLLKWGSADKCGSQNPAVTVQNNAADGNRGDG